jgi:hypothetical protein
MKDIDADMNDDFMQFILNKLNEGYSEYKRNHPNFARIVEEQLEGKTEAEFEEQFEKPDKDWYIDHCKFCGEYLPYGVDMCPECGRFQLE